MSLNCENSQQKLHLQICDICKNIYIYHRYIKKNLLFSASQPWLIEHNVFRVKRSNPKTNIKHFLLFTPHKLLTHCILNVEQFNLAQMEKRKNIKRYGILLRGLLSKHKNIMFWQKIDKREPHVRYEDSAHSNMNVKIGF